MFNCLIRTRLNFTKYTEMLLCDSGLLYQKFVSVFFLWKRMCICVELRTLGSQPTRYNGQCNFLSVGVVWMISLLSYPLSSRLRRNVWSLYCVFPHNAWKREGRKIWVIAWLSTPWRTSSKHGSASIFLRIEAQVLLFWSSK